MRQLLQQLEVSETKEDKVRTLDMLIDLNLFRKPEIAYRYVEEIESMIDIDVDAEIFHRCQYRKAVILNMDSQFEKADISFETLFQIYSQQEPCLFLGHILLDRSACLLNRKKITVAEQTLFLAENIVSGLSDSFLNAKLYVRKALWKTLVKDSQSAILFYLKASKELSTIIERTIEIQFLQFQIEVGLGTVYESIASTDDALSSYLNALDLADRMSFQFRKAWVYFKVGNTYINLGKETEAKIYLEKVIQMDEKYRDIVPYASSFANLGQLAFKSKEYEQAENFYQQAEKIYSSSDAILISIDQYLMLERWIGELYLAQGKAELALKHLTKAIQVATREGEFRLRSLLTKDMAEYYNSVGNYQQAYVYLKLYTEAFEQYQRRLKMVHENEQRERYEAENRQKQLEIMKLEANKLQLKALRSQMNPHFIYNTLNAIQLFILKGKNREAATHMSKFATMIRQSLEYSDKDFIPLDKELSFLHGYLELNKALRFENKFEYEITLNDDIEPDMIKVPSMILQPYIENALEHGVKQLESDGKIRIHFSELSASVILCTITDNGPGINATQKAYIEEGRHHKHRSLGTSITEKRLELLSRTFSIDCRIDIKDLEIVGRVGTQVEVKLPCKFD